MNAKILILLFTILSLKSSELEVFRPFSKVVESMNECGSVENGLLHRSLILGLAKTDFDLAAKVIRNCQNNKMNFDKPLKKLANSDLISVTKVFDFLDINQHKNINLNKVLQYIIRRNLITQINPDLQNIASKICLDGFKSGKFKYQPVSVFVPKDFTQEEPTYKDNVDSQFSPNNKYFVICCGAHVIIRDLELDQEIQKIEMFLDDKFCDYINMEFSSDSKFLVISDSQKCIVWDLENNKLKWILDHAQVRKIYFLNDNFIITKSHYVKCTWDIATGQKLNEENRHQKRYYFGIHLKKQLTDQYSIIQKRKFEELYFYNFETKFEYELKTTKDVESIHYLGNNRIIFKSNSELGIYDIATNKEFLLDFPGHGVSEIVLYDDLICVVSLSQSLYFLERSVFCCEDIHNLQRKLLDKSQSIFNQVVDLGGNNLRVSPNRRFVSARTFQKIFLLELKAVTNSRFKSCFKRILQKLCARK